MKIDTQAYVKIKLHAFKYPHLEVSGLLLGENDAVVTDSVPLLHTGTRLMPMVEVGLRQIASYCKDRNLKIIGYYEIPAIVKDLGISAFGQRISDLIAFKNKSTSYMISMDNQTRQFKLWTKEKGNDTPWTRTEQTGCYTLEEKVTDKCLEAKVHYEINDFDNWLDDPVDTDYMNGDVNSLISVIASSES